MADVTASETLVKKEGLITGTGRFKVYEIQKNAAGVTAPVLPGSGYKYCIGMELGYTESGGTFTGKLAAGTDGDLNDVLFITG